MKSLNAKTYLYMIYNATNALHQKIEKLNRLNVFPIPDGDTGFNMYSSFEPLLQIEDKYEHLGKLSDVISNEILKASRGNSGTILATFFYGLSKYLSDKEECNTLDMINAFKEGTNQAYNTIGTPKEGTILTLMKKCSEIEDKDNFVDLFLSFKETCETWLKKTPELLPVLKEAGVIDSGAYGFTVIIRAMYSSLIGENIETNDINDKSAKFTSFDKEEINFKYCCEGILEKNNEYEGNNTCLKLKEDLSNIGESEVFVETNKLIKFHIHVNNDDEVIKLTQPYGHLIKFKVDNMKDQLSSLIEQETLDTVIVPIVNGDGLINVYNDIGVNNVVNAGEFINVSNNEIIQTLDNISAKNIILLPNNRNNILTCKVIAKNYQKANIVIVPTTNAVEGIVASLKFKEDYDLNKNKIRMTNALNKISVYAISKAIRDSRIGRLQVSKDDYVVIRNDEILYAYKNEKLAIKKICSLLRRKSMISIYFGENVDEEYVNDIAENINYIYNYQKDIITIYGGQPVYRFLILGE